MVSLVKLNPNAELWVRALESGAFAQGRVQLHTIGTAGDPDLFCCLGVACQVAVAAGVPVDIQRDPLRLYVSYDGGGGYLPLSVQSWLGLSSRVGAYTDADGYSTTLALDNDSRQLSFSEIAHLIRTHPELFKDPTDDR